MAEIWGAAIAAGAAVAGTMYSSNQQKQAAKGAANAQTNAANAAIQETEKNYNRTAQNLDPYISSGNNALNTMNALNSGDYSSFKASPDYQFSLDQGLQGLDRSAAARGSLYSGGHSADILNYAQGLASQNYNQYYNRLAGLAGMGQSAASNLGSIGTGNAASIGNYLGNAGNAQANSAYQTANANTGMANTLVGLAGQYGTQWGSSYMPNINANYGTPNYNSSALAGTAPQVGNIQFGKSTALYS